MFDKMLDKAGKAIIKTQSPRVPNTPLRFEEKTIPKSQTFWIQLGLTSTLLERIVETTLVRINLRAPNKPLRLDGNTNSKRQIQRRTNFERTQCLGTCLQNNIKQSLTRQIFKAPSKPLRLDDNTILKLH
jgi:hypothetical protein